MKLITNGRLITRDAEGRGYYEHGAVAYEGAKIAEVPVRIAERAGGESYLKPVVAVRYMAKILISILLIQNFRKRRKG